MLTGNFYTNAFFVGFVATLISSIFMVLLRARGKEILNLHLFFGKAILGKKASPSFASAFALVLHLFIGTLVGFVYFVLPLRYGILTGILYSILPWLVMMVALFPLFGQGLFAEKLDKKKSKIKAWLLTLIFHLLFGILLGFFATL